MMDGFGFQMIIGPLIKALEPYAAINRLNVRQEVSKVLRKGVYLFWRLKMKFLCHKFDCCTQLERSFLEIIKHPVC